MKEQREIKEEQNYKTHLSNLVERMLEESFKIEIFASIDGKKHNYSISALIHKQDNKYAFKIEQYVGAAPTFHIRILAENNEAFQYVTIMDRFWCTKHPFKPLDQEMVNLVKQHIQNGRIQVVDQSNEGVTKCKFVNQQGNVCVDFQVENGSQVRLLKMKAENFHMPQINATITGPTFVPDISNDIFQIDPECENASFKENSIYETLFF